MTSVMEKVSGSFRDPSGFLFYQDGQIFRQISNIYKDDYDLLRGSGLYKILVNENLMVEHEEVEVSSDVATGTYKIIKPVFIPFISYPYEWCFSQLKDAALLTLRIQELAMGHGMTLKDASAYNVQFLNGKPIFIDTLSFEKANPGQPWSAYRQFCQHFFAPLYLMANTDIRLNQLSKIFIDGIPLDLADSLLPMKSLLNFSCLAHIKLHSHFQGRYADSKGETSNHGNSNVSNRGLQGILESLKSAVNKLKWEPKGTVWADYYSATNYSDDAMNHKAEIVNNFLKQAQPGSVWDLGANNGFFSRIAASYSIPTISLDFDPAAVEQNYRISRKQEDPKDRYMLPLLMDLTNPSGDIGWSNQERSSLIARGPADTAMALALIHHLAISNNIPLDNLARFFAGICKHLIIEFVPKSDSQVKRLLASRKDIFCDYNKECFEKELLNYFDMVDSHNVNNSDRIMYLFKTRNV